MNKPPTSRQFGNALRKKLKELSVEATVKVATTTFAGLGYGEGCFASIHVEHALSPEQSAAMYKIKENFKSDQDKFKFTPGFEKNKSTFVIQLKGPDYPFGGKPKPLATNN